MKFFIPLEGDPAQAEDLWRLARELLHETGFPTEDRRIFALFLHREAEPRILQVGVDDEVVREPVLIILRAADAPFYWVLSMQHGMGEGAPIPVPAREVICAVDFE